MKYTYEVECDGGIAFWLTLPKKWSEEAVLKAYDKLNPDYHAISVRYHRPIPNGTHLCSCGNVVDGLDNDILCEECAMLYGHSRISDL